MIELENLYYRDKENIILHEVTIDINKGGCISIVGESGSGKSTLPKICADLIEVKEGNIKFKGKDYSFYEAIDLRKKLAILSKYHIYLARRFMII